MDLFRYLFDTSQFPPRWSCGHWTPAQGWLHIAADLGIWSAYVAIPCVLGYFWLRRRDLPFRMIFLLFGAFILACGTTHLLEALIFWFPIYNFAGLLKVATAFVSWATVIALVPIVPRVMAMRSPEELQAEVDARFEAEHALRLANDDLEQRIGERTAELVRANASLRLERERFRTTLASIGDAVIATDADARITFMNPVAEQLTAWSGQDALGQPLHDVFRVIHETTRLPVESPVEQALREGGIVALANHSLLIPKVGPELPIDDSAAPIRDSRGTIVGVVLVFRDIAERYRVQGALRASEQRLRLACDAAQLGIWVWDIDADRVAWENERPYQIFGIAPDDGPISGSRFRTDFLLSEYRDAFDGELGNARTAGQTIQFLGRFRRLDGELRWIELTGTVHAGKLGASDHIVGTAADVTDRQLAQEQYRQASEANAKFRAMFEQSAQFAGILSLDGAVLDANHLCLDGCGYARQDVLGKPFWECGWWNRSAEVAQRVRAGCARAAGGELFRMESEYFVADGSVRHVELTIAPVTDEPGRILYLSASGNDVTERFTAHAALRASQAHTERQRRLYEAILTNTPDLAYVFDLQHRFIYANDGLLKMWGRPREEAIGKNCLELGYEPWHAAMHDREIDQIAATGQPIRGEVPFTGTYGRRDYEYILVPVFNERGEVEAVAGTTRDMTERKRDEQALQEAERRWRNLAEALPNLVWTCRADGECDYMSSQWRVYTGLEVAELLGTKWVERVIHHDDRSRTLASWQAACEDRGDYDLEYRIRRYDGQYRWFKTRGVAYRDAAGRITHWFGTCTDIEDRKRAEAALQEADRRKNEFLAMLAHELRNPLAPIRNAVEIFRGKSPAVPEVRMATDLVDRQVNQMTRLIDDLLDVSRITSGKIALRKARIALADAIQGALEVVRPLVEKGGHTLHVQLPAETIYLNADLTRVAQIVMNLLNNAAKYTDAGGHIWLSAERGGEWAIVRVRDTGTGIAPEMLAKVFDMFTQEGRSLERSEGGLGIGLTIVQRLVELHGGTIEAASEGPGRGSEFTVRLPLDPELQFAPTRCEPTTHGEAANTLKRRILVVDDKLDAADSMAMLLRMIGHEVQTAHDGLAAVDAFAQFRPDVVLLDIGLPKLNGYEVARRIRVDDAGEKILIVALTGWGQEEDRSRTKEAGFDYHLTKPVEFDTLVRIIDARD